MPLHFLLSDLLLWWRHGPRTRVVVAIVCFFLRPNGGNVPHVVGIDRLQFRSIAAPIVSVHNRKLSRIRRGRSGHRSGAILKGIFRRRHGTCWHDGCRRVWATGGTAGGGRGTPTGCSLQIVIAGPHASRAAAAIATPGLRRRRGTIAVFSTNSASCLTAAAGTIGKSEGMSTLVSCHGRSQFVPCFVVVTVLEESNTLMTNVLVDLLGNDHFLVLRRGQRVTMTVTVNNVAETLRSFMVDTVLHRGKKGERKG